MAKNSATKKSSILASIKLKNLLLPALVIIVVIILGFLKNQFVAASVNGEQINRLTLIRDLEKREGQNTLENLINEKLLMQETKKKKISVSDDEVNREIEAIEKNVKDQGQNLDDILTLQGLTREQLREQIKTRLNYKKLIGKIEITDKEINDFLEQNKDAIPQDAKMDEIKTQVKAKLEEDKIDQKLQSLIESLRKSAKIEYLLKF